MPSQMKYLVEACVALLLAVVTVKTIDFFSYAKLVSNPSLTETTHSESEKTSPKNSAGKILFSNNCSKCHSITKQILGPPLAGVTNRVPDREILIAWIKNNKKVLQSGNPYFNNLYAEYNKLPMDVFPQLDDNQIKLILDYIEGK